MKLCAFVAVIDDLEDNNNELCQCQKQKDRPKSFNKGVK